MQVQRFVNPEWLVEFEVDAVISDGQPAEEIGPAWRDTAMARRRRPRSGTMTEPSIRTFSRRALSESQRARHSPTCHDATGSGRVGGCGRARGRVVGRKRSQNAVEG